MTSTIEEKIKGIVEREQKQSTSSQYSCFERLHDIRLLLFPHVTQDGVHNVFKVQQQITEAIKSADGLAREDIYSYEPNGSNFAGHITHLFREKISKGQYHPPKVIRTLEDFFGSWLYHLFMAQDGQIMIENPRVFQHYKDTIGSQDTLAVGGNAGNMAVHLSRIYANGEQDGPQFLLGVIPEIFDNGFVRMFPDYNGLRALDEIGRAVKIRSLGYDGVPPVYHIVSQFSKGDFSILDGDVSFRISRAGRFIPTWNQVTPNWKFDAKKQEQFERAIDEYQISGVIVAGFQTFRPDNAESVEAVGRWFGYVRQRHPRVNTQFEFTDIRQNNIFDAVLSRVVPYADIVGANRTELADILAHSIDDNVRQRYIEHAERNYLVATITALAEIVKACAIPKGIFCVHDPEVSVALVKLGEYRPEEVQEAMQFASQLCTNRVYIPNEEYIEMGFANFVAGYQIPISQRGAEIIARSNEDGRLSDLVMGGADRIIEEGRGLGKGHLLGYSVVVITGREMPGTAVVNPVGSGDLYAAILAQLKKR